MNIPNDSAVTTRHELTIAGMHCGSCAASIAEALNDLDGVEATVDFAMGRADVIAGPGIDRVDLVAVVVDAGYIVIGESAPLMVRRLSV